MDSVSPAQVLQDPWILVPELFSPGYVGGWSAAEHWGLTEQIFRSLLVFTARSLRPKEQAIQGIPFVLRQIAPEKIFGLRAVWRETVKVSVSDPHRTIVDMMNDPSVGGGIRQVASCLKSYLASKEADVPTLLEYAERFGNGAVLKRLGFLLSAMGAETELLERRRRQLTAGNAKLDPALPCRRLVKKWRLWVPDDWVKGIPGD